MAAGSSGATHGLLCRFERFGRRTADGIPYVVPEIQLLFKSKGRLSKDEADFDAILPLMDRGARG